MDDQPPHSAAFPRLDGFEKNEKKREQSAAGLRHIVKSKKRNDNSLQKHRGDRRFFAVAQGIFSIRQKLEKLDITGLREL